MSETCATCRFWLSEKDVSVNHGACVRSPPTVTDDCNKGMWPITSRLNWCGEHQPREVKPEQPKAREPGWYWTQVGDDEWTPRYITPTLWRSIVSGLHSNLHVGPHLEPPA